MTTSADPATNEDRRVPAMQEQPDDPIVSTPEPNDPVDGWMASHTQAPMGDQEPGLAFGSDESGWVGSVRRLASRRTLEPRLEWLQWYLVIGALLLVVGIVAGTVGWLLGWTVAAITMTVWPLIGMQTADRRLLLVAGAALLVVLLIAWQLDAHTKLGALALVENRDAIIGISALAALLGAFAGTGRWLVIQSGIWCLALAGSGWYLSVQSRSFSLMSEWQAFLPDKLARQLFAAPIPKPFDFGEVLWLTLASTVLFATCAFAGLSIGAIARGEGRSISRSAVNGATLAVWLSGLLTPDGKRLAVGLLLLLLAMVAGTKASGVRDLLQLAGALAAGVLTREALDVAWNGLEAWWGPRFCDDFLFSECRPSADLFTLIAGCGFLFGAAAVGYYGRRWMAHRAR